MKKKINMVKKFIQAAVTIITLWSVSGALASEDDWREPLARIHQQLRKLWNRDCPSCRGYHLLTHENLADPEDCRLVGRRCLHQMQAATIYDQLKVEEMKIINLNSLNPRISFDPRKQNVFE